MFWYFKKLFNFFIIETNNKKFISNEIKNLKKNILA